MVEKKVKSANNEKLASFGQRFLAIFIDGIILMLIGSMWRRMFGMRFYQAISTLLGAAYAILLWVNWQGQTPGKKAMRIKVVNREGKALDYKTAVLRYLGYIVSAIPFFLGYFWVLWDQDKEAWHDKIAGTKVIAE